MSVRSCQALPSISMPNDQWMRAGLRGELSERGYDAVGATDLSDAVVGQRRASDRGPIGLALVDQEALGEIADQVG